MRCVFTTGDGRASVLDRRNVKRQLTLAIA
jgi:hypothetical protein